MITRRIKYGVATLVLSVSSLFVLAPQPAFAAAASWDGEGADDNFSTAANWVGDVVPSDGDTLTFDNTGLGANTTLTNDLTGLTLAGVSFTGSGSYSYTVGGNSITIGGAISGIGALATDIVLSANTTVDATDLGSSPPGSQTIDTSGFNITFIDTGLCGSTLYSNLAGSGDMIINLPADKGINVLGASPSYTGDISVLSGRVGFYTSTALGQAASLTINGGKAFIGLGEANQTIATHIKVGGMDSFSVSGFSGIGAGCAGGIADPIEPVTLTLSGGLELLSNANYSGYYANLLVRDPYITNGYTFGLHTSSLGTLTLPGNIVVEPVPQTVEYKDNLPAQIINVHANTTAVVTGTYGGVSVFDKGILKGTGTVAWLSVSPGGKVAPGLSPGVLNTGDLNISGGTLEIEIGGTTPGTGDGHHDQTNVTGTVALGTGTTLTTLLWNGYSPAVGESYVIVNNDGSDAVTGTFSGLAQDASFTQNGITFSISYTGGDGNDVVLTVTAITATAAAPDTGFAQLVSNPLYALVGTILIAGGVLIARRNLARR